MPDLNAVLQYGSFGVIVLIILWIGYRVVPDALEMHRTTIDKLVGDFRAESKEREDRHDRELARRDAGFERVVMSLDKLSERVGDLENRTDEHPPLRRPS